MTTEDVCSQGKEILSINSSSFMQEKQIEINCLSVKKISHDQKTFFGKLTKLVQLNNVFNFEKEKGELVKALEHIQNNLRSSAYDTDGDSVISKLEFSVEKKILENLDLKTDCNFHNNDLTYCDEKEFVINFSKDSRPTFKYMLRNRAIPHYLLQ